MNRSRTLQINTLQSNTLQLFLLVSFSVSGLLFSSQLMAQTQLELLYTGVNPDYKPYSTSYGAAIAGQYDFDNGLFVNGYFNAIEFEPSGPDAGHLTVKSWAEAGLGYAFDHDWGQFYSLLTVKSID
ncbi:MAG: hypothetical protein DRQ47_03855, partial [Gammaproteobacteria bacterium]